MSRISLICIVLSLGCLTARADEPSKATVKKLAKGLGDTTIASDCAKVIDNTYPAAVKVLGGRKEAIELLETAMKQIRDKGYVITKYEVGEPGDLYTEGGHTFVIVPTAMEMKFPAGKIRDKSYLLAISSDGGKTWTFLDGSGLQKKEFRDMVLPKMPDKLKLPEKGKPEITKDK